MKEYIEIGFIKPSVRAWKDIESALTFAEQTDRAVILLLDYNESDQWHKLQGHKGRALQSKHLIKINKEGLNC